jgi:parallel beta-helix repeat protein
MRNKIFVLFIIYFLFLTNISVLGTRSDDNLRGILDKNLNSISLSNIIVVPDDYSTIQEAINNSENDDIIFVRNGIYYENIFIGDRQENITLIGENKDITIIDGKKNSKNTITISSPNTTIQGFSIINGQNKKIGPWSTAGIQISSPNVTIKDNLIMWNLLGINALNIAHNLTIVNNSFKEDSILLGIYEHNPLKFTINSFLHTITNNTVNGKPLYFYKNADNFTVPNDAGQIILVNCTNSTIKDTYFTQADFPVIIAFCSNCILENLTIDNSYGEFILFNSDNCTIQNNSASHIIYGICLDYKSEKNLVQYNKVSHNFGGIVVMMSSRNNKIYHNYIKHNSYGISLFNKSYNNVIIENKISDNTIGIKLEKEPYDNIIINNSIERCSYAAMSMGLTNNYWYHNYWNRPRILPKPIFAYKMFLKGISIPYLITDIDWNPAKKPYEID